MIGKLVARNLERPAVAGLITFTALVVGACSGSPAATTPPPSVDAAFSCPVQIAGGVQFPDGLSSTVDGDLLKQSLIPPGWQPTGAGLCRYQRSGDELHWGLEGFKNLSNPADLGQLATLPNVAGNHTYTCPPGPDDAHAYVMRLVGQDAADVVFVMIPDKRQTGLCGGAANGHFVTESLGTQADLAWADGAWPRP